MFVFPEDFVPPDPPIEPMASFMDDNAELTDSQAVKENIKHITIRIRLTLCFLFILKISFLISTSHHKQTFYKMVLHAERVQSLHYIQGMQH